MLTIIRLSISIFLFVFSIASHAALYDRGNGMIYDSTQNITWLQDFRFANPAYRSDFYFTDQANWANGLDYGGYSDWRLPSIRGTVVPNCNPDEFEVCDNPPASIEDTELGHLLYVDLGNYQNGEIYTVDNDLNASFIDAETGEQKSFFNLSAFDRADDESGTDVEILYWFREGIAPAGVFYALYMPDGSMGLTDSLEDGYASYAVAVRDGDVIAAPLPASVGIFSLSLMSLLGVRLRRKIH